MLKILARTSTLAYKLGSWVTRTKGLGKIDTCGRFHKHFTLITDSLTKIRLGHPFYACFFVNVLAYFGTAVVYECKMLMKLTPGILNADVNLHLKK
jgi:hypothetical protein